MTDSVNRIYFTKLSSDNVAFPVAMAFVTNQTDIETYPVEDGFNAGTIYPVLDKPFLRGNK